MGVNSRTKTVIAIAAAVVIASAIGAVAVQRWRGQDNQGGDTSPVRSLRELSGTWRTINDAGAPAPLVQPVTITITGDQLTVATGCNAGGGRIRVKDSHLELLDQGLAITEMACAEPLMTQERWVIEMLQARPRLETAGPYLSLIWGTSATNPYWLGLTRS